MNEKIGTFFGHRSVIEQIDDQLYETVCRVIGQQRVTAFYVGGHGEFDGMCAAAVRKAKRRYPDTRLILVKPRMTRELNTNREYYSVMYDDVIIPPESDAAHYKAAIKVRNQWMAAHSDVIIAYLRREYGGAFDAVKYAQKLDKQIIKL